MRGSKIIVTADPRGLRTEGTITDTSKPGTHMEIVPATAPVGGRFSWRCASTTSVASAGAKSPKVILLENWVVGKIYSDAYAANERCFLYYPNAGDELNLILGDVSGTGDAAVAIGDFFGIDPTTTPGKLKRNSSYTSTPYHANEAYAAGLAADIWLWVTYRGDQA